MVSGVVPLLPICGVPVIAPVEAVSDNPFGKVPLMILHVCAPVPPPAVKEVLYAEPTDPVGSVVPAGAVITNAGGAEPTINCSVLGAVWGVGGV